MATKDEKINSFNKLLKEGNITDFIKNHLTNYNLLVLETINEVEGIDQIYIWLSLCGAVMAHSCWGDGGTTDSHISGCGYKTCALGAFNNLDDLFVHEDWFSRFTHYHDVREVSWTGDIGGYLETNLNLDSDFFKGASDSVRKELDARYIENLSNGFHILYQSTVQIKPETSEQKVNEMTTETKEVSKISRIAGRVKTSGVTALQYQAGKALNSAIVTAVKKAAPIYVRGYLDHPAAPVVIAIAMALGSEFLPEGDSKEKVIKATDLMLNAAAMDGSDKFLNLDKLIASVFEKLPKEVLTQLEQSALTE